MLRDEVKQVHDIADEKASAVSAMLSKEIGELRSVVAELKATIDKIQIEKAKKTKTD